MPIFNKILLGFGVIILVMIFSNGYMLYELNEVSKTANNTLTTDVRAINFIDDLMDLLDDQERYAQKYFISRDSAYYDLFIQGKNRFSLSMDSLAVLQSNSPATDVINRIQRDISWFNEIMLQERYRVHPAHQDGALIKTITDTLGGVHSKLRQLVQIHQAKMGDTVKAVRMTMDRSLGIALIFSLSTLFAAIILAVVIARTITQPIEILIQGADNIANESFIHIKVKSRDEIAKLAAAFNEMSTKLKNINELKADLMHEISHELRNPLSTILGAHYLLASTRSGQLTEEQMHLLEIIRESAEKLTTFSHQFLELAKVEANMMTYHFARTDILPIVKSSVEGAQVSASRKSITINLKTSPVQEIMADPEKISIIIGNLLSNAVKYSRSEGKVDVVVAPCDIGLEVSVIDSGIGISTDDLPYVFTKFFRAKNSQATGSKGTGIGLALVKAFTERHGGRVSVSSAVNAGSVFRVEFPAALPLIPEEMHPGVLDKSVGVA